MSQSNNLTRALLAVSVLGALALALGRSFSWTGHICRSLWESFKGKENLSIEGFGYFLDTATDLQVQCLSPQSVDVFNARVFDDTMEATYTAYWAPGYGRTEIIHVKWEGKRGMIFTLVEGQMTEFQRPDTLFPQQELWDHDAKALGACVASLRRHIDLSSAGMFRA